MFKVIDKSTGQEAEIESVCKEKWARDGLAIAGYRPHKCEWAIDNDGCLMLIDSSGNWIAAPDKYRASLI